MFHLAGPSRASWMLAPNLDIGAGLPIFDEAVLFSSFFSLQIELVSSVFFTPSIRLMFTSPVHKVIFIEYCQQHFFLKLSMFFS